MSFNSSYTYHKIGTVSDTSPFIARHVYSFISKGNEYHVELQELSYKIYCVKFFDVKDESSSDKFNILKSGNESRFRDVFGIVRTCINICLEVLNNNAKKGELASFMIIGSNSIGENTSDTKRHKLYSKIIYNHVSPEQFFHYASDKDSTYFLLNRNHTPLELQNIKEDIIAYEFDVRNVEITTSKVVNEES